MSVLFWEAQAAEGRVDELVAFILAAADPGAEVFRSDEPDARVVVIDPTGKGIADVASELIARPPHAWSFDRVAR